MTTAAFNLTCLWYPLDDESELTLEDLGGGAPELHEAHIRLWKGFDRWAAGEQVRGLPGCPACLSRWRADEQAVALDFEPLPDGRYAHFVLCGRCGFQRPSFRSESLALADWAALHRKAGSA